MGKQKIRRQIGVFDGEQATANGWYLVWLQNQMKFPQVFEKDDKGFWSYHPITSIKEFEGDGRYIIKAWGPFEPVEIGNE